MVLPVIKVAATAAKKTAKELAKEKRIAKFRREASRKASMANKRLARLEKNNLTDTPAYKQFMKGGGKRFGIKGKTYNEVRSEVARLDRFINAETSTIRGVNRALKETARITGLDKNKKYKRLKDLRKAANNFFELQSMLQQYMKTVHNAEFAHGYTEIWQAINVYTDVLDIDLTDDNLSVEELTYAISQVLEQFPDTLHDRLTADDLTNIPLARSKKRPSDYSKDDPDWF